MNHEKIVEIINNGGLVILPTDTVYGIMGDALDKNSIEKVNKAKKRDKNKKLVLLASSIDMVKEYTKNMNELEQNLYEKYSKYSLTIGIQKNDKLPEQYDSNVGFRIPNNDDLIEIINLLGRPIFSTSANISGQEVITDVSLIDNDLKKYIDYIYDGGTINNLASTIVKVENDNIIILREGKAGKIIKNDFKI